MAVRPPTSPRNRINFRQCQRRHKNQKQTSGRFLASGLNPEAQKRLAELRKGLD